MLLLNYAAPISSAQASETHWKPAKLTERGTTNRHGLPHEVECWQSTRTHRNKDFDSQRQHDAAETIPGFLPLD